MTKMHEITAILASLIKFQIITQSMLYDMHVNIKIHGGGCHL